MSWNPSIIVRKISLLLAFIVLTVISAQAQVSTPYKFIGKDTLSMDFFAPDASFGSNVPVMVFYFGGGWTSGTINQFRPHAEYFVQRGIACALVEYRTMASAGTSPFASLRDAKSAIRFIRANADSLGVDPERVIGAGGSAGGHLAAATALIDGYNEPSDNMEISCKPNALVLFNPVIDNGPGGYGYNRIMEQYHDFSPLHNIEKGAPPTILVLGTADRLIPLETVKYYKMVMEKVGSRCDLHLYEGQEHGFFNYKNFEYYEKTVKEADLFLQSLGWLDTKPKIKIK